MKTSLLTLMFSAFMLQCITAQNMNLANNDGSTDSYAISSIKKIILVDTTMRITKTGGTTDVKSINKISQITFDALITLVNEAAKPNNRVAVYPNPSGDKFSIKYILYESAPVDITIYNMYGEQIKQEKMGVQLEGINSYTWNATNDKGEALASGTYFCRVQAGTETFTNKLILIK